ncbi:hypothetical protein [Ochrovirga pacifica]|uniref:hypothetical protein n=1 Tax=Ochrovirga pacifica TaxID=1042376 RepID=UPI0002557FE7|nr:hypothetical protein [Ochrovirga pacifica]
MKNLKRIFLLSILVFCNSCIVISPKKNQLIDAKNIRISKGIQITINEAPRALGSNKTTIEIYDHSENQLVRNKLIKKKEYKWFTTNNIQLDNGKYKLVTYYNYIGKDRFKTENIFNIENNIVDIVLEYPLFMTGKARLKINETNLEMNN